MARDYCGCCGRENPTSSDYWCRECSEHVDPRWQLQPHDRTWFAQHGTACPVRGGPLTAPDVAAALARLQSRGAYAYRRGELAEPGRIDFDADLALLAQALATAELDRAGDLAILADCLNSCLREASLPEVRPYVESIQDGMRRLLDALNRTQERHARGPAEAARRALTHIELWAGAGLPAIREDLIVLRHALALREPDRQPLTPGEPQ